MLVAKCVQLLVCGADVRAVVPRTTSTINDDELVLIKARDSLAQCLNSWTRTCGTHVL